MNKCPKDAEPGSLVRVSVNGEVRGYYDSLATAEAMFSGVNLEQTNQRIVLEAWPPRKPETFQPSLTDHAYRLKGWK